MVCCIFIAALLGLLLRPALALRNSPLAWRLDDIGEPAVKTWRHSRWQSFRYAFAGLGFVIRNEPNMRFHLGAAILVVVLGLMFPLNLSEWRWLVLAIGLVMTVETANTAIEQACNATSLSYHPAIKAAKDVAAGATLLSALVAVLIGASIFAPHVMNMLGQNPVSLALSICGVNY